MVKRSGNRPFLEGDVNGERCVASAVDVACGQGVAP
jgi:hypothetical protein